MTIDDIRAALREPAATLASLTAAAADARALAAAAEADIAALNGRRPDVALNGSDKDLAKLDDALASAGRTVERASVLAEACTARAAEVQAAEDERARGERYADAQAVLAALPAKIEADYRTATALFQGVLEKLAKVDLAVAAVNADLPEGKPPLPPAESFRAVPSIPGDTVMSEVFWLYCEDGGRPLADQARVKPRPNGMGFAGHYAETDDLGRRVPHATVEALVKRLPFRDVTTTRARHFRNPSALAAELSIPPLHGETNPGWRPAPGASPRAVLAKLPECNVLLAPSPPSAAELPQTSRRMVFGAERDALMAQFSTVESA